MERVDSLLAEDDVVLDALLLTPNLVELLQGHHTSLINYLSMTKVRRIPLCSQLSTPLPHTSTLAKIFSASSLALVREKRAEHEGSYMGGMESEASPVGVGWVGFSVRGKGNV